MAIFTAISAWATAALGPGALSIAGLSPAVTSAIFTIGRSALWSMAGTALTKPSIPRQQVMATLSQTDMARVRAYGRNLLGGLRVFWEANDGRLFQIVVIHHGQVDGLIQFWIDGEPVTIDSEGKVEKYKYLWFRDGSGNGGDYAEVRSEFPALWTTNHKLVGQATFCARWGDPSDEEFPKVFPKGPHTKVQAEVRGSRVRNMAGALIYSDNAALCIRDLLTHPDGWNIPTERLDPVSWQAMVNRCNQSVGLIGGDTEMRYRVSGFYALSEPLKDVTAKMLSACDGQIFETADGTVGIIGGAWSDPDVTISGKDILSLKLNDGFDPFDTHNILKGSFVSPAHAYQRIEVAPRRDEVALQTQEARSAQFDVDMSPSSTQTQRLMKIKDAKERRKWIGTLTTNLVGMKARFPKGGGIHTIRLADTGNAETDGVYEVLRHRYSISGKFCEIELGTLDNPYNWSIAEEKPLPKTLAELAKPLRVVPPPTGASLTQVPTLISGDLYGGKLRLTVAPVTRGDLTLQAQVAEGNVAADANVDWTAMGGDRFSATTGILQNTQPYTVRYRWRGQGDWIKAGTVTIVANPNVPSSPTGFSRVGSTGAQFAWVNPADNFWKSRLFRNNANTFTGASFVADISGVAGQSSGYTDTPGAGTWYYWIVALNGSSVASPPAGPVTLTI